MTNIVLIVVDTLRASHLSCYGYFRETSPVIDKFAKQGIIFMNCSSQSPWTIPSFTSILTGLFPEQHRVVGSPWNIPNSNVSLSDDIPTLPELLQDAGYTTVAVDNLHQMASHPRWFGRGFEYYINPTRRSGIFHHHVKADEINKYASEWLSQHKEEKFFMFLHYWDPHLPYNQPAPYDKWFSPTLDIPLKVNLGNRTYIPEWGFQEDITDNRLLGITNYDNEIRYLDNSLDHLINLFVDNNLYDDTLFIFTGDHGESMLEHGVLIDHQYLYQPTLHVPLIFWGLGNKFSPNTVENPVQHIDIAKTILDLTRIECPPHLTGDSLVPSIHGHSITNKGIHHAIQDGRYPQRMICQDNWKLIQKFDIKPGMLVKDNDSKVTELYDLSKDPYELSDVGNDYPDKRKNLESLLTEWLKNITGNKSDPLNDDHCLADFFAYPGDPTLEEFYKCIR